MAQNIDRILEAVESHLPGLLVPPESLARIESVARLLPIEAVGFFGFECRLGEEGGPTDCAVNLTPEGARMLARRSVVPTPRELTTGVWERVRRFYQAWGDSSDPPYADAGATWLEFDSSAEGVNPNLLFGYWQAGTHGRRSKDWLFDDVLPALLGAPMSPTFRQNLLRGLEACPPGTDDFQIGVMLARSIQAVRLCVFDIPPEQAVSYLDRVGWSGPRDAALATVRELSPHADFVGLHLDIGERVHPHLHIEPNFVAGPWARQPHMEPRWNEQLETLVRSGLCTPAQRDALLSWVGYQSGLVHGEIERSVLLRGLSHLKITLRPGARALAKAYFGISERRRAAAQEPRSRS